MRELLKKLKIDYLLVNSTNEYLVEYSALSENARYTLTGFSGSTGDALVTKDKIYLFVDGRYHVQAEQEVKEGVEVVKLQLGQKQDEEIRKLINPKKTLGIVAKKISQARLETFKGYKTKLLKDDPINSFIEEHATQYKSVGSPKKVNLEKTIFVSNLEEVSYITGYRDFTKDYSSKIWAKMIINGDMILFTDNLACENYLKNYKGEIFVDKNLISAYDYSLIKKPVHKPSEIKALKSIKTNDEIETYKKDFRRTDKALMAVRDFIEANDVISESDIENCLRKEFAKNGAKCLSFKPIIAINKHSALAHYSKSSKRTKLKDGDLVLIDCGAYFESGLATDITRVFVKGKPSEIQREVYTKVLKAFLNCFNYSCEADRLNSSGFDLDSLAHEILDDSVKGFLFSHGLGHGIGINVHEAPPALNQSEMAKSEIKNGMCFTIEPGLYNSKYFGVRLENSCYMQDNKIHSFTKMGFEDKLINYNLLNSQEKKWLKGFKIL